MVKSHLLQLKATSGELDHSMWYFGMRYQHYMRWMWNSWFCRRGISISSRPKEQHPVLSHSRIAKSRIVAMVHIDKVPNMIDINSHRKLRLCHLYCLPPYLDLSHWVDRAFDVETEAVALCSHKQQRWFRIWKCTAWRDVQLTSVPSMNCLQINQCTDRLCTLHEAWWQWNLYESAIQVSNRNTDQSIPSWRRARKATAIPGRARRPIRDSER